MSSRLNRVWLIVPFLLIAMQAWALGLGDIRLSSALNEPLRAEIELLAATPEELNNLTIQLASQETFARYDLDRPIFLTGLQFNIVKSGRADGNVIRITSREPITEPFITFLVEASWSRGRLLREYTLLLDPPTFAPPPTTQATEAVTAPTRAAPADSGQIQRPAPPPQTAPPPVQRQPVRPPAQSLDEAPGAVPVVSPSPEQAETGMPAPEPVPATPTAPRQYDIAPGGEVVVVRGDTLWGITQQARPDARLTMNQMMLAIYEANPAAFDGNINRLRAGATLRIPAADDVFRISRREAFAEVLRQNNEWRGAPSLPAPTEPAGQPIDDQSTPSLTLVPPDAEDDLSLSDTSIDAGTGDDLLEEVVDEVATDPEERIQQIEAILEDQDALIEIPDNELAALRQELADLRGEAIPADEAPIDELPVDEAADEGVEIVDDEIMADDAADQAAMPAADTAPPVVTRRQPEESLVDKVLGYVTNLWVGLGAALLVVVAILVWFMRRAALRDDEEATGVWDALDSNELDADSMASTERLRALARDDDESFVVVETETVAGQDLGEISDTMEAPAADESQDFTGTQEIPDMLDMPETEIEEPAPAAVAPDSLAATDTNKALEDTFSSETAINLDQSDPVAEADFHMAYGLYDQAADLINGALAADPDREDLLAKLCEIYFVWGNRDAFVDAAQNMKAKVGSESNAEWDKIVIMGQQIAAEHEMFSGVSAEGVTRAVDLSFDGGMGDSADLDMDFAGGPDGGESDVIDLGAEDDSSGDDDDVIDLGGDADDEGPVDFGYKSKEDVLTDETGQVLIPPDSGSGIDFSLDDDEPDLESSVTREMPAREDDETIESTADGETAEMPAGDATTRTPTIEQQFDMDATGEMPAAADDRSPAIPSTDATAEIDLDDLGLDLDSLEGTALGDDLSDELESTSENEAIDLDDLEATGKNLEVDDADALGATGIDSALTEDLDELEDTSTREVIDIEDELAATGELPSLDEGDAGATGISKALSDDEATMLASLDDDDDIGDDTDVGIDTSLLDATGQTQILTEDMAVESATGLHAKLSDDDATMLAPDYGDDDAESDALSDDAATMLASLDDDEDEGDFDFAKTEALPKDVFSPDMSTDDTGRMPGLTGSTDMDLDLDDLTAALKVSEVGDTVNQLRDDATVQQPRLRPGQSGEDDDTGATQSLSPEDMSGELSEARTMTEVGTKLDLARAYVDMGDPSGAKSILEEVLDEGDEGQKQQAQQLIDSLPT